MSTTNFAVSINNIATTVATNYTVPAAYPVVLGIASAAGITISGSQWIRISTFRAGVPYSILKATAPIQANGVGVVSVTSGGSGGTNGTYTDGSFTGGGGGSGGAFTYTISGGAVQASSVIVTNSGSGYTSAPTPVFGHSVTGVVATATVAAATVLITGTADGYPDQALVVGDAAELRVTAGAFNDLSTAVNALESGANLQTKPTAIVATTAALAANTYANGTAGVGATLTATANGALAAIDGYTPVLNDLILVKNESAAANNGLYTVTQVGDATHPYILTRSVAMDVSAEYQGAIIYIGPSGTTNKKTVWECTNTSAPTVGTTSITFGQVGGSPGGASTNVQYNSSGVFGGNSSFTYDGTGTVSLAAAAGTATFITPGNDLTLSQTGDTDGTCELHLRNRSGSNGALFKNVSKDWIDFSFQPSVGAQQNIRLEHRQSPSMLLVDSTNTTGEFQFFFEPLGTPVYVMAVGHYSVCIDPPKATGCGSCSSHAGTNFAVGGLPINTTTRVTIYAGAAGNQGVVIQQAASPTALPFQVQNSSATALMSVRPDGSLNLPVIANASAVNSSLFIDSSASNKLCWKDSGGTLHYST
jgi:hypothetical protein